MRPLHLSSSTTTEENRKSSCAIEISDAGIAYASVYYPLGGQRPVLKECEFFPRTGASDYDGLNQLQDQIAIVADKYGLKGVVCNLILHPKYYRLLLTDIPKVAPNEYREAVKWQIKDMIDYPIADTTLDIFMSSAFSKLLPAKLYVVVAKTSFILNVVNIIHQNFFNLVAVDIREFAIRNLLNFLVAPEKPVGFLHFEANDCLFIIVENRQLSFVRHIPLVTAINDGFFDSTKLLDEIQRSLDYYGAELKQRVPVECLLSPTVSPESKIVIDISKKSPLKVTPLSLNRIVQVDGSRELDFELQKACYLAVGGALRRDGGK